METERQKLYNEAFSELETERPIGMSRGFIPITKIWQWAEFYGFDKAETRALTYVITTVDRWKLEFEATHKPKD